MRNLFLITVLSICFSLKADEMMPSGVVVRSDQYSDSIPAGYYLLKGSVLNGSSGYLLPQVKIMAYGKTDPLGYGNDFGSFSLLLPVADSLIAFHYSEYQVSWFEHHPIKEKHQIELVVNLYPLNEMFRISVDKPVIYAYAQAASTFSLQLLLRDRLKFVYPKPDSQMTWHFCITENELLESNTGEAYPYLFWESEHNSYQNVLKRQHGVLEGTIVKSENLTQFLHQQLSDLGMNPREKTDFITYWAPRMQDSKYVFIQFQQNEECNQFAKYNCSPTPEAFNRFYMLFHQFENLPENLLLKPQHLKAMQRQGLYLVEWGGMELPLMHLLPAD